MFQTSVCSIPSITIRTCQRREFRSFRKWQNVSRQLFVNCISLNNWSQIPATTSMIKKFSAHHKHNSIPFVVSAYTFKISELAEIKIKTNIHYTAESWFTSHCYQLCSSYVCMLCSMWCAFCACVPVPVRSRNRKRD